MSETVTPTEPQIPVSPASPGGPSSPPTPSAAGEGEGTGGPEPAASPPPTTPEPSQPPTQPDWRDKRIATLTRRLRELQEGGARPAAPAAPAPHQPDMTQAMIDQRANEIAIIKEFNRRCDETALNGRAQYGETEFNGRIANLQKLSDPTDPTSVQAYNAMLSAALEAGEPERLLYELGADLNEAQRILAMSPTRMAVEMTRRAAKPSVQISNTPKPITPLGGRPESHERIAPDDPDRADHLSTAEWMRRRERQIADKIAAERGR